MIVNGIQQSIRLVLPFLQLGPPKLNVQKEANQLRMGKEIDEKEDFLYQIRTKVSSH